MRRRVGLLLLLLLLSPIDARRGMVRVRFINQTLVRQIKIASKTVFAIDAREIT